MFPRPARLGAGGGLPRKCGGLGGHPTGAWPCQLPSTPRRGFLDAHVPTVVFAGTTSQGDPKGISLSDPADTDLIVPCRQGSRHAANRPTNAFRSTAWAIPTANAPTRVTGTSDRAWPARLSRRGCSSIAAADTLRLGNRADRCCRWRSPGVEGRQGAVGRHSPGRWYGEPSVTVAATSFATKSGEPEGRPAARDRATGRSARHPPPQRGGPRSPRPGHHAGRARRPRRRQ